MISESTKKRLTQRPCRKIAVVTATDVIPDVTHQSSKDSVEAGFCGEPFADNSELLSSLSPLLFSMKLFGLYFHREDRHRRRTDDPEWNPATTTTRTSSTWLRVFATVMLILAWFNTVRLATIFTGTDYFGADLLMKLTVFTWCCLDAIFQTASYYASHTGQLVKILLTLPVTRDCVRGVRRTVVGVTAFVSVVLLIDLSAAAVVSYSSDEANFILAPFVTYIKVPEDKMKIAKIAGYMVYVTFFPGVFFAHSMNVVLVYIFYSQFKQLKKTFRRALGKSGQFTEEFSIFRRRHQKISRAVSKLDSFMRISNVAGFVFHIVGIILILYIVIFYPGYTSVLVYLFWLMINVNGLLFSASAGIIVNHMVRIKSNLYCLLLI